MDIRELQKVLLSAARGNPPGDRVPLAFEKRISARLRELKPEDPLGLWSRALWFAAAPCLAFTVLLAVWSLTPATRSAADTDLSQQLEHAVLAEVAQDQNLGLTW